MLRTAREVTGLDDATLLAPAAPHVPVTLAELVFGVTHEGARTTSRTCWTGVPASAWSQGRLRPSRWPSAP